MVEPSTINTPYVAAVLPFEDRRAVIATDTGEQQTFANSGLHFRDTEYRAPVHEMTRDWFVRNLEASGAFSEVRKTSSESEARNHGAIVLQGRINSLLGGSRYFPLLTTPFLGWLWFTGIPFEKRQFEADIEVKAKCSGKTLWNDIHVRKQESFRVSGLLQPSVNYERDILARTEAIAGKAVTETVAQIIQRMQSPSVVTALQVPSKHAPVVDARVPASAINSERWAVIVGVSRYQDTRVPALRYASADARAFHRWAVSPAGGKYPPARTKLLVDEHATGGNIKDALFNWLGQALEEDIVTIYFAGHGSPQSPDHPENLFLLPYDCRYDNIPTTGFPMWDIETALKRYIKAKKVVVIADACHSGGIGQSFDIARRANRGLKVNPVSAGIQGLSKIGEGVCVISASDENQYSQESKTWGGGHGVFTYFLLRGLLGHADYNKDTSVTLGELTSYLSQEVRRETRNSQSPTVAGRYDPALTIGK